MDGYVWPHDANECFRDKCEMCELKSNDDGIECSARAQMIKLINSVPETIHRQSTNDHHDDDKTWSRWGKKGLKRQRLEYPTWRWPNESMSNEKVSLTEPNQTAMRLRHNFWLTSVPHYPSPHSYTFAHAHTSDNWNRNCSCNLHIDCNHCEWRAILFGRKTFYRFIFMHSNLLREYELFDFAGAFTENSFSRFFSPKTNFE